MKKLLIVEDDRNLGISLAKFLEIHGFKVDIAYSYEEAVDKMFENNYDLYLIDINLGDGDGIKLLQEFKSLKDDTPAIFITALKDISTMARGFEAGAEDYIKKPFDLEELLLRIKSRLKKKEKELQEVIKYNGLEYKNGRFFKDDKEIELGHVQRSILLKLLKNKGKIVPKEDLYELMINPSPTALRVALTKIKKKTGIKIKAIRGLGYTLD